jgi:curli biogenesis system outer membrane secretion channel CsgG
MKKQSMKSLTIAATLTLLACSAMAQETAKIAVTEFDNKAGADSVIVDSFVDMLTTAIVKSGKFNVVERDALTKIAREQNFGSSGAVEPDSIAEMGKLTGADYLLLGIVTEVNDGKGGGGALGGIGIGRSKSSIAVDIRFVDATTAEIKFAETFREERASTAVAAGGAGFSIDSGTGAEMARALIDSVTRKVMMSVYPATVVMVDASGQIALNYGDMMFHPGQKCDIYTLGDTITDPVTGKKIGSMESKIGELEIVSADARMSQGKLTSGEARQGAVVRAKGGSVKGEKKGLLKRR